MAGVLVQLIKNLLKLLLVGTNTAAVNKYVVDLKTLIIFAVVPFNLLKGLVTSILTVLLYKKISPLFKN